MRKIKPELWFYYSWVYEDSICIWQKKKWHKKYEKEGRAYSYELRAEWEKIEDKVFQLMEKHSGFKWKMPIYEVYVVHRCIPFSSPLTITIYAQNGRKIPASGNVECIIHELVHKLEEENPGKLDWKMMEKFFPTGFSKMTSYHLFTCAIEWLVLVDLYGENRAKEEIQYYHKLSEYGPVWKVVEKEGAENIIKKLIK